MNKKHLFYAWLSLVSTILILLLMAGFLSLPELHTNGYTILNQVELQRTRVERMAKDAWLIADSPAPVTYAQSVGELQVILPAWEKTQKGLQVGDSTLGLPRRVPSDVLLLIIQSQPDYTVMDSALHRILARPDDKSAVLDIQAQIVLDHESKYYYLIGQVYTLWLDRIDGIEDQLYDIELVLIAGAIAIVIINFIGMMRWQRKVKRKVPEVL